MQVAVAQMAEADWPRAWRYGQHCGCGARDEIRDRRHRHRDIVLDGRAPRASAPPRCFLRNFHSAAAWAWLAATTASVAMPSSIARPSAVSKVCAKLASRPPVASISTYQGERDPSGSRAPSIWRVTSHSSARRGMSSKALNMPPVRACITPSRLTAAWGVGTAARRGHSHIRLGKQAQGGGGDDAQRALAANEQLLEVIARIVLVQRRQHLQHRAIGLGPLPAPARGHGSCHSAAHGCRRHWWRYCRRWCSCPPRPG